MRTVEANIEINRIEDKLSSISVVMPIWDKHSEDGFISVITKVKWKGKN